MFDFLFHHVPWTFKCQSYGSTTKYLQRSPPFFGAPTSKTYGQTMELSIQNGSQLSSHANETKYILNTDIKRFGMFWPESGVIYFRVFS